MERQQAVKFLARCVKPSSRLYTDRAAIYKGIERWWPVKHEKDLHAKWEFSRTFEFEGLFGNFRTFIRKMNHHVTPEKMPEYAREFLVRFFSPEIFISPNDILEDFQKSEHAADAWTK